MAEKRPENKVELKDDVYRLILNGEPVDVDITFGTMEHLKEVGVSTLSSLDENGELNMDFIVQMLYGMIDPDERDGTTLQNIKRIPLACFSVASDMIMSIMSEANDIVGNAVATDDQSQ